MEFTRTGKIKKAEGLVDFLAEGYIEREGEEIPCQIGYNTYMDAEDDIRLEADYIFLKDGITESGTHYYAETIRI